MSEPSFENIDRWLFEYVEGNLSERQVEQLESFISRHPDLQEELDFWQQAKAEPEQQPAFNTASLQKPASIPLVPLAAVVFSILLGSLIYFNFFAPTNSKYQLSYLDLEPITLALNEADEKTNVIQEVAQQNSDLSANEALFKGDLALDFDKNTENQFDNRNNSFSGAMPQNTVENVETGNSSLVISSNYAPIVAYLSSANEILENVYLNEEKENQSGTVAKRTLPSYTMKSRFQNTLKKIKRMADQPIALQNSRDPNFHTPMMTGFQSNFGMVGTLYRNRFQATTRQQWINKENQQLLNTFSWDGYIYALRGGLGIDATYTNYQDGSIENFMTGLTYSPKLSVSENVSIEPAFRFKMGTTSLDLNSPIIGNAIERTRQSVEQIYPDGQTPLGSRLWYRDVGAGLLVNTKWFYTGVNVDNLRRHYDNIYSESISSVHRAQYHFTAIAGTEYAPMNKNIKYAAFALFQNYGDLSEIWIGGNVQFHWLEVGASVSNHLDVAGSLGVRTNVVSVHYNLDYVTSRLYESKFLSHQLTLRYVMKPSRYVSKFLNKNV